MPIRPFHRSFVRAAVGSVWLCMVAATHSQARMLPSDNEGPLQREADNTSRAAIPAWWAGFREPAMLAMQRVAASRAFLGGPEAIDMRGGPSHTLARTPLDAQVAAAFVAVRVLNVRQGLADQLISDLSDLRRLAAAGAPTPARADVVADFEDRLAAAERHAQMLQARRDELIGRLAAWCGVDRQGMPADFRAALDARTLPAFDAAAPQRLARAVLIRRTDVSLALGQRAAGRQRALQDEPTLADAAQRLSGWIEAPEADARRSSDPPVIEADDELERIVEEAEQEVRDSLAQLWARHREAAQLAETLRTRQLEVLAAERRVAIERASPAEVLLARQKLLFEGDRLAIASGDLALAWMRLESSTGGQALNAAAE